MRAVLILCAALVAAGPARGQKAPAKFTCTFERQASPETGKISKVKPFKLNFLIDITSRKAYMVGNNGVAEVRLVAGDTGMTFLEVLGTGAVQSTTMDEKRGAVHSRHTMIAGGLVPSQYYGTCR